jgi:hypothetical protein
MILVFNIMTDIKDKVIEKMKTIKLKDETPLEFKYMSDLIVVEHKDELLKKIKSMTREELNKYFSEEIKDEIKEINEHNDSFTPIDEDKYEEYLQKKRIKEAIIEVKKEKNLSS